MSSLTVSSILNALEELRLEIKTHKSVQWSLTIDALVVPFKQAVESTLTNENRSIIAALYKQFESAVKLVVEVTQKHEDREKELKEQMANREKELKEQLANHEKELANRKKELANREKELKKQMANREKELKEHENHLKEQIEDLRDQNRALQNSNPFPTHTGSVSRQVAWSNLVNDQTAQERSCEELGVSASLEQFAAAQELIDNRKANQYTTESLMYKPIRDALHQEIPATHVLITSGIHYLDRRFAPDISLYKKAMSSRSSPEAMTLVAPIEIKLKNLSDEDKGQLYDYLLATEANQPPHSKYVGILTNIEQTIVMVLSVENNQRRVLWYTLPDFHYLICFLKEKVMKVSEYAPVPPEFTLPPENRIGTLGNPRFSSVAAFKVTKEALESQQNSNRTWLERPKIGSCIAVKRSSHGATARHTAEQNYVTPLLNEIKHLRSLRDCISKLEDEKKAPVAIPRILYYTLNNDEFGFSPVGETVHLARFVNTQSMYRRMIEDLIDGVEFLHKNNIIHRDLRWDNVVLDRQKRLIIIDYGTAIEKTSASVKYLGGYQVCPYDLIGHLDQDYAPKFEHDNLAILQMVLISLFPQAWRNFKSRAIEGQCPEATRLKEFWKSAKSSSIWKPFYQAAVKNNLTKLREIIDTYVVL